MGKVKKMKRTGQKCEADKLKNRSLSETVFWMRMSGLEPMTPCMSSRYSNQLSYTLTTKSIISQVFGFVNPYLRIFYIFLK